MIVPQRATLRRILGYVGWALPLMLVYDLVVVATYELLGWDWLASPHVPLGLYGSVVGVVVGFRNNSSYARWWEARQLWGSIVNNSRSVARQALVAIVGDMPQVETLRHDLVRLQIAYVHALRLHLRRQSPWTELARILPEAELLPLREVANVPLALQRRQGELIQKAVNLGALDRLGWQAIDRNLDDLADAQGGCERIKNTPMPKQYDWFPRFFVFVYCLVLPMGLVPNLGWVTPLGSTLVGFMFLSFDKIGRDLQDPFDNKVYDVPITAISTGIEIDLRQLMGEKDVPAPVQPVGDVLW